MPDPELLPIPATDGTVRVVVEGGGWSGYDRSCTGVASADSYHSVGFERAYVQMTDARAATHGANAVVQIARPGGLVPGVHDVAKDGSTSGQLALTPADHPHIESQLDGKLWIRTADTVGDETLLEVSYYGTTRWRSSTTDETEADVKVEVSFRARLRTTDVP